MIIEFIGLPGAGKTTLRRQLTDILGDGEPGVRTDADSGRARSGSGRLRRYASYCVAAWRWRTAIRISAICLASSRRPWREKLFALRLLVVSLGRYHAAQSRRTPIVMMDEGFIQRCFTVLVDGPEEVSGEMVRRLASAGPHGDMVVHLKIDPEVALRRLSVRQRGLPPRFAMLSHAELLATFRMADRSFGEIAAVVSHDRRHPADVVVVESDDVATANKLLRNALDTARPPVPPAAVPIGHVGRVLAQTVRSTTP
jgi:shikimate kinase